MQFVHPKYSIAVCSLILLILFSGCAKKAMPTTPSSMLAGEVSEKMPESDRMIIRTASLTLEVSSIGDSISDIISHILVLSPKEFAGL